MSNTMKNTTMSAESTADEKNETSIPTLTIHHGNTEILMLAL